MAVSSIAPVDHAALDAIMTRLETVYGHDPRVDRGLKLFLAGRVSFFADEPTTALVHGDSGRSYHATVNGFCECPDTANVRCCKHQLAVKIAAQMRAVGQASATMTPHGEHEDARQYVKRLCMERLELGKRLSGQGIRPIDDPTWVEYGEWIAKARAHLQPVTFR